MTIETENKGLSRIAIRGTGWYFFSFFSGKLMSFLTTVILARLLTKDDFGLVAYALTFISFLEVTNSFGIDLSLIYHKEDERTSNASFWLTTAIGLSLFLITFFMAPWVGVFFNDTRVIPILRVMGLTFIFQSLGGTHSFLLRKKLAFGLSFVPDFTGSISKGVISILCAYMGYGSWSLVWGQVGGSFLTLIILWVIFPWRPAFMFDTSAARSLLAYGFKIMGVDIISILSSNVDYLFVGRYLGSEILGVYTLAFRLPELLIGGFARIMGNVMFPIFTHMKDTTGDMAYGLYTTTRYVSLITVPLGVGLALVARPFTLLVFTEKWIDLVPIIQALAIFSTINTLTYNIGTLFKAEGHPHWITWLELGRFLLLLPSFIWAVIFVKSVVLVAWMHAVVSLLLGVSTIVIAHKKLGILWTEILKAILPSFFALLPMIFVVTVALRFTAEMSPWIQSIVSVLAGIITYTSILWFFQRELFLDALQRIIKAVKK